MSKSTRHLVNNNEAGQRLDKFLASKLRLSRAKIQKLIGQELIRVNDRQVKKHYKLKLADIIEFKNLPTSSLQSINIPATLPQATVIKASQDYIIVNKPANLVVHADSRYQSEQTLLGQLLKKYPEIAQVGENKLQPGIVQRLDKDVSGVMIIARTQKMFDYLKIQFKNRQIHKEYLALVQGQILPDEAVINFVIDRKKSGFMAAKPRGALGQLARTKIIVKQRFRNFTLIKAYPLTGRTHQIRVHLFAYGHPIVGEKIYTSQKHKLANLKQTLNRPFLHAAKLGFFDLAGNWQEYTVSLPKTLQTILDKIS